MEAFDLISEREPSNWHFKHKVSLLVATAMKTSPTGFLKVAPVGPAIPVMLIPKSVFNIVLTLLARVMATSALTAP